MLDVETERDEVIRKFGPWIAHNVELRPGVYTIPHPGPRQKQNSRGRQVVQLIADIAGTKELSSLRIADLGCLEGGFAIELAKHGAEVVGIEGREGNIERARFSARTLGLDRCTFECDDVRNLGVAKYGIFDFVLCLGILYHLEAKSVFALLENTSAVCRRALILDTQISLEGSSTVTHRGEEYSGRTVIEHGPTVSAEQRAGRELSSLDNPESFWLTRPSLYNSILDAGFTSVLECHIPQSNNPLTRGWSTGARIQLVAFKGSSVDIRVFPAMGPPPRRYVAPAERPDGDETIASMLRSKVRALQLRGRRRIARLLTKPMRTTTPRKN